MCAGAIAAARIARLYYGAPDPRSGGVAHGARVFGHPQCHHRPEVYGGIAESASAGLLRAFFADRRVPGGPG
jgi:tRNA(Arg) A34 adenosine deaminase TadA